MKVKLLTEEDGVYLEIDVDDDVLKQQAKILATKDFMCSRAAEGLFENPDGSPIVFDTDYCGNRRTDDCVKVGPLNQLIPGYNKVRVW